MHKYRSITASMLPTDSRVHAVLDKKKHVLRVVLNSWFKAEVQTAFSESADTDHWTP